MSFTNPCCEGRGAILRLKLLGTTRVTSGERVLEFPYRKALALLAYLALTKHRHPREKLVALLHDGTGGGRANAQFRTIVSALHKEIGDHLVVTRQTVEFDCGQEYWLDVDELRSTLSTPNASLDALEHAVTHYEGDLLAGLHLHRASEFEPWLVEERSRIRELVARALYLITEDAALRGEDLKGIEYGMRVLELQPWHEETHRLMMSMLARSGQVSRALEQFEICRAALLTELGCQPLPETTSLFKKLHTTSKPSSRNLPPSPTMLIGRESQANELLLQLSDPACRLVTIVGLAGMGKSALALHIARRVSSSIADYDCQHYQDGVCVVHLTEPNSSQPNGRAGGAVSASALASEIFHTLVRRYGGKPDSTADLAAFLSKKEMLLVLDSFEHGVAGASLIESLVHEAPKVKILVTARATLGLLDERVLDLGGLTVPTCIDDVMQSEAGRLFIHEIRKRRPTRQLNHNDLEHAVDICRLVNGLPLGLILAARVALTTPLSKIATSLARDLDLLATTDSDLPERHQSMQSALAGSWRRLSGPEQQVLRQLSVFPNRFTLEAAQAVAGATLPVMRSLGERTLLSYDEHDQYAINDLVRRYAAGQIAAQSDEVAWLRARHAAYFTAFVRQVSTSQLFLKGGQNVMQLELENVHAAWNWAVLHSDEWMLGELREGLANCLEQDRLVPDGMEKMVRYMDGTVQMDPALASFGETMAGALVAR